MVRGAGFATTAWTDKASENARKNKLDKQFETFMTQEDLNCSLLGVSDLFELRADQGVNASQNDTRPGGKTKTLATKYRRYEDLLANDEIDAVIIATPDHWHAQIIIDAAKAENMSTVKRDLPGLLMRLSLFMILLKKLE